MAVVHSIGTPRVLQIPTESHLQIIHAHHLTPSRCACVPPPLSPPPEPLHALSPSSSASPQVRKFATEQYATTGLHLHPHTNPVEVRKAGDGTLTVVLKGKDGQTSELTGADQVLMATGRVPKTQGLGLEEAGVKLGGGAGVAVCAPGGGGGSSSWGSPS